MADQPQTPPPASRPPVQTSPTTALPPNLPIARPPIPSTPPPAPRDIVPPIPPQVPHPTPMPPPAPAVPTPIKHAQSPAYTTEVRTMSADIGRVSTGQTPTAVKPIVPNAPAPTGTPGQPSRPPMIVIPPASENSGSGVMRKAMYAVLALAILGALIWLATLIFGGSDSTTTTPTPTPSTLLSSTPTIKTLSSYFKSVGNSLEIKPNGSTASTDFTNLINTSQPPKKDALRFPLTGESTQSLSTLLGAVISGTGYSDLSATLGNDWTALSFGQSETFDASGQPITSGIVSPRLVLISEVTDASAANQAVQTWQDQNMINDVEMLFSIDSSKSIVETFSIGTYREISIHYRNFPYADQSIDWAVVTGSNNKNYLVISGSREAIFFVIDQLNQ